MKNGTPPEKSPHKNSLQYDVHYANMRQSAIKWVQKATFKKREIDLFLFSQKFRETENTVRNNLQFHDLF